MINFEPDKTNFTGKIKRLFREFIKNSESLKEEDKAKLIEELGDNWFDRRFDNSDNKEIYKDFIENAIQHAYNEWSEQNFKLMILWKKVVIENSGVSETPEETANRVVEEFKKNFITEHHTINNLP